eukprot:11219845-Karenia_brevis.AAC.1
MFLEAHSGGWEKAARQVLSGIAKHAAAAENCSEEVASLTIAQRLSTSLHRENARAIVCRLQEPLRVHASEDWTLWTSSAT